MSTRNLGTKPKVPAYCAAKKSKNLCNATSTAAYLPHRATSAKEEHTTFVFVQALHKLLAPPHHTLPGEATDTTIYLSLVRYDVSTAQDPHKSRRYSTAT